MARFWTLFQKSRLFFIILFNGIVIIATSMAIIALIASYNLRDTLKKEVIEWNFANLRTIKSSVEVLLEQINVNCLSLLMSDVTTDYENSYYETLAGLDQDKDSKTSLEEYIYVKNTGNLVKMMADFSLSNNIIYNVYFYDIERGRVITSDGLQYPIKEFYDKGWMEYSMDSKVFPVRLGTRPVSQRKTGYPKNVVTVVFKTFGRGNFVVVNIDAERLVESSVSKIVQGEKDNTYYICRIDGKIMLSDKQELISKNYDKIDNVKASLNKGQNSFIDGDKVVFFYYSNLLDNYFITTSNVNILKGGISKFTAVFYPLIFAIFTVAAGIYFFIIRRAYKPIRRLVKQVDQDETLKSKEKNSTGAINVTRKRAASELEYIEKAYSDVKTDRTALAVRMADLKPLVKSAMLNNIIFGQHNSPEEAEKKINEYEIDIPVHNIYVAVFDIKAKGEKYLKDDKYYAHLRTIDAIKDMILPYLKGTYTVTSSYLTLIASEEEQQKGLLHRLSVQVTSSLSQEEDIICSVGISKIYSHIFEAGKAYSEAVDALKYKVVYGEGHVISANDIKLSDKFKFRYPTDMESQLIEFIILGASDKAGQLITRMIDCITDPDNNLSIMQIRQFLFVLFGNIIKQLNNLGLEINEILSDDINFYESLLYDSGRDEIVSTFNRLISKITERVSAANSSKNSVNVEKIIQYIKGNFHLNISLESTAEYVYLNPSYVSRLLKKETGSTFTEYLTAIRMNHAKALLKNSDLKIEEIAIQAGYNNTNYFIRTFKGNFGFTPGEYRRKNV